MCSKPIDVKTGSLDTADFATTRHLIHWRFLALRAKVWATVGILWPAQKKTCQNLLAVAHWAKPLGPTVGISRMSQSNMPMVSPTIARSATVNKLDAQSNQNPPDLVNQFSHRWVWYSTDCCFKTAHF
jgi:hypothetical protein